MLSTKTRICQESSTELLMINVRKILCNSFILTVVTFMTAGSVLRMFQHAVGDEIFRDGLNRLLVE